MNEEPGNRAVRRQGGSREDQGSIAAVHHFHTVVRERYEARIQGNRHEAPAWRDERCRPGLLSILAKYHTEFCRSHKFSSFNSALSLQFRECWPAVTASVVEYYGRKRKGYFGGQQAFGPIHVMMDWPDLAAEPAGPHLPARGLRGQPQRRGVCFPVVASVRRWGRHARARNHDLRRPRR